MDGDLYKQELEERIKAIEAKLDLIIQKLSTDNTAKDFGIGLLANLLGNRIDGR